MSVIGVKRHPPGGGQAIERTVTGDDPQDLIKVRDPLGQVDDEALLDQVVTFRPEQRLTQLIRR